MTLTQLKNMLVKIIGTDDYFLQRASGDLAGASAPTPGAGSVGQTQLKSTNSIQSTSSTSYVLVTLAGGEYAFAVQSRVNNASYPGDIQMPKQLTNTSYATNIAYRNGSGGGGGITYIRNRYVQA